MGGSLDDDSRPRQISLFHSEAITGGKRISCSYSDTCAGYCSYCSGCDEDEMAMNHDCQWTQIHVSQNENCLALVCPLRLFPRKGSGLLMAFFHYLTADLTGENDSRL